MLIIATTVLNLPTLLTAEPNLPLLTAAENISDLLRDAPEGTHAQYARNLAQNVPKSTPIDVLPVDRSGLFQAGPLSSVCSSLKAAFSAISASPTPTSSFMKTVRLAFNDESQQGGQAGYTVLGANLPSNCLQCLTGDKEQHKSGTGGEKIKEAPHERLSQKAICFLGGPLPRLPHELLASFFAALCSDESSAILMTDDHSSFTPPSLTPSRQLVSTASPPSSSVKILDFLTTTREAQARNLVALTRSKCFCVLLLPSTDRFPISSLDFLRTFAPSAMPCFA